MMKKMIMALAVAFCAMGFQAKAIDLKDILGNVGAAASGVVDGLLTQTDITIDQMAGTWTATGSAVCFQSENALKKAGGNAVAGTIESKLDPYYKKYGLIGSVLTIQQDGSFTLKAGSISLKGTIAKRSDGNFDFTFTPFGSFKLGTIKAYVEKPMSGLNVMFDATKLKSLLSAVAGLTGNSLAKTAGSLLDSYEGLCVGFAFSGKGSPTTTTNSPASNSNSNQITNDDIKNVGGALKNILGF